MKKLIAAIAVASLAVPAVSQAAPLSTSVGDATVTLYGTLDVGVWAQDKWGNGYGAAPGIDVGSQTRFQSGGIAPSKWGLTGTKKLGDDVTGIFTLEEHINLTSGKTDDFGVSGFLRQAFLGFTGSWGTVLMGEQFTASLLAYAATDPRGLRETMSGLMPWVNTSGEFFGNGSGGIAFDAFAHNAISYTGDIGKLHLMGTYGLGNTAGGEDKNAHYSVGAVLGLSPVTISAGLLQSNGANGNKATEKRNIGAGFSAGAFSFKANYLEAEQYNAAGTKIGDYKIPGVGVEWQAAPKHKLGLAFYEIKDDVVADNTGESTILYYEYAWNPSVTAYAQASFVDAKQNANAIAAGVRDFGGGSLVKGTTSSVINVGVAYHF